MKELPKQSSSDKKKKPDSAENSGQTSQNGAGSSQPAQNGTENSQPVQSGTDSSQSTQNSIENGQAAQSGTGSSQSTPKTTETSQNVKTDRKDAEAEKGSKGVDTQTKVVEGKQKPEESASRPAVTMAMEDTTILTPENLQMAKDQNLDLLLQMGKYATWNIDIDSVDMETVSEVDMGIELGTENVPTQIIADMLDGNKYLEFTLAHDGPFAFRSLLQIAIDPMYEGWYANLFYYNEETKSLEFICDAIIDSNGIASFDMEHASSYVIIVSPVSMAGMTFNGHEAAGDSGSHGMPWIVIGVIVCIAAAGAGCGIFFYRKKMQEEEDEYDEEDEETEEDGYDEEDEDVEEDGYGEEDEDIEEDGYDEEDEALEYEETEEFEETEEEYEEPEEEEYEEPEAEEREKTEDVMYGHSAEDDWIEDEDWQEPETPEEASVDRFADDHAEDDWIDDDEWDIGNDWIDDEEWARRKEA